MKIKNYTPHPINIVDAENNSVLSLPSEGIVRLKASTEPAGTIAGIPVTRTVFGQPEGLPEYSDGTFYIVSQIVKSALPQRNDLLVPAEVVRDAAGNIIGCKSLGV